MPGTDGKKVEEMKAEWADFKAAILPLMAKADPAKHNRAGAFHGLRHIDFWRKAAARFYGSNLYRPLFCLVALTMVFPWDNSCCERAFSCMNRIKCKSRSRLGSVVLDHLMRISIHGVPLKHWDPRPAIARFLAMKNRVRGGAH